MSAFYHSTLKNLVTAFGSHFSNLHIIRRNGDSRRGEAVSDIRVPIAFSNRSKWIQQLLESTRDKQVKVTLPRIGFEISSFTYDASRKKNKHQNITCSDDDGNAWIVGTPAPWNIDISMYIVSDNLEDCLQVIEQILPQFNPDLTLSFYTAMDIVQPVPLSLTGCSYTDTYEGSYTEQRLVIYTLNFTARIDLYNVVQRGKVVTEIDDNWHEGLPGDGEDGGDGDGNHGNNPLKDQFNSPGVYLNMNCD